VPAWVRGVLFADMLVRIARRGSGRRVPDVDADALAAWLSMLESGTRDRAPGNDADLAPQCGRRGVDVPVARAPLMLAERGRETLAKAFQQPARARRHSVRSGRSGAAAGRAGVTIARSLASACGLLACTLLSCVKVPIDDVDAGFTIANTAWFEEEQTLFVFYSVSAEQGLG
jgi:hypothetical protein